MVKLICLQHVIGYAGQNKNQFVMGYFMWRGMTGQHQTIEFYGTKCRCRDMHVVTLTPALRHLNRNSGEQTDSMDQLEAVVQTYSVSNEALRYPSWKWRDWKAFLGPVFRPIRGIREYQYFRFEATMPGVVTVRKGRDEEEISVNILKTEGFVFDANAMPSDIQAPGLSLERQTYLFRTIRPFVRPAYQDITCPPL